MVEVIRDHYYARVGQPEVGFRYSQADEDSLTGALGQALLTPQPILVGSADAQFAWSTTYQKIRGRGTGAPEKEYGADGIFELEVSDPVKGLMRRKGLLFQAKKVWTGSDRDLLGQTRHMRRFEADSIIIDYTNGDYRAFDAGDVVEANGRRDRIPIARQLRLAEVLGDQVLECTRGVVDLVYDPAMELVHAPGFAGVQPRDASRLTRVIDRVSTVVERIR